MQDESLTIARAAGFAGVGVETIRYYERRGLIPQPTEKVGAYRRYDGRHVARIRFIKRAQELGFTLDEIESLLELEDGTNRTRIQQIAEARLAEIRERISDLRRMADTLEHLLEHCRTGRTTKCPIIEALAHTPAPDRARKTPTSRSRRA